MPTSLPAGASYVVATDQLSTELAGEIVILGLRDGVYYGLAGAGARVWQLLQTPQTLTALIDQLRLEFDVDAERLRTDLERLLEHLRTRGLVAIHPEPGA